ncbi:MAG TPA: pitrilysin family protein [Steroidobacter sp.]|nr:pitrilysin family protein [Steroidobacter sp.]
MRGLIAEGLACFARRVHASRFLLCRLTLLVLAIVGPFASASADGSRGVKTPPFERVLLPNGAVLLLMERRDVPLIAFNALVRGGAAADPASAEGSASLLAGLLEKGAGKRNAFAFAQTVASVGGQIETGATTEAVSVGGSFLARDQKLMVELLADMLQRPHLASDEFETLRKRHIEFIRSAKDSDLAALTPIYGAAALFAGHPYGRPVNGSEGSLSALAHSDVQRYYEQQVGADRLILTVVGDFRTADMKQLLTRAFSGWRKAGVLLPPTPPPRPVGVRRVLLVDAPQSVQSYFWAGALGVARNDPRRAPLDVVNTLFGGRFTSMLNSELRIRTGLSYGASSRFDRMKRGGGWEMSSFTQTATTIEAIDLAFETLEKLRSAGFDETLLASAKRYVQGQFPLALETASQWAYQLGSLELYELNREYIDGYAAALDSVSADAARGVIATVFPKSDEVVLVVVGQAAKIRDGLRKYGPITEMKLSDPAFAPSGPPG